MLWIMTLSFLVGDIVFRDIRQPTIGLMDTWINVEDDKRPLVDLQMLPTELVQTMVTNCSVVASIIVCWNHNLRHDSKVSFALPLHFSCLSQLNSTITNNTNS